MHVVGPVSVRVLDERVTVKLVPPSQWRGDGIARPASAAIANLMADDGLRAQVSFVHWGDLDEFAVGFAEVFAGPSDYERLEQAGVISPKPRGTLLVARIRALRYGRGDRATSATIEWPQISHWAGRDAQSLLAELGATRTGSYGALNPDATRFRTEPAVEVPADRPEALFAVYALTRVVPIMTGYGKTPVEGPHA